MRIFQSIKRFAIATAMAAVAVIATAQETDEAKGVLMKMNPYARMQVINNTLLYNKAKGTAVKKLFSNGQKQRNKTDATATAARREPMMTVMLKTSAGTDDAKDLIQSFGGRTLLSRGSIHIAAMPVSNIASLAECAEIERIEASPAPSISTDTTALLTNALPAYKGENIDHGYNGEGVIVGVADIGFDLTHPNFYNADMSEYRIKRLWDILSTDTLGQREELFTGHEYTTEEDILALKHSYDGEQETHGTHTAGTAAGGGYDTPYRGIAWGSELCLVSTVTSDNYDMIDSLRRELLSNSYLGSIAFDYIFNYAQEQGKPCVINYSIGSPDDYDSKHIPAKRTPRLAHRTGKNHRVVSRKQRTSEKLLP